MDEAGDCMSKSFTAPILLIFLRMRACPSLMLKPGGDTRRAWRSLVGSRAVSLSCIMLRWHVGLPTFLALMLFYSWRVAAIPCIATSFRVGEVNLVADLSIVLRLRLMPPEFTRFVYFA